MESSYLTSVSVLHSGMVAHLEALNLQDVSKSLKDQIPLIMLVEKKTRRGENELIEMVVLDFFEDCRTLEPGSSEFVQRFHEFMDTMMRAYFLEDRLYSKFCSRVAKVDVERLVEWNSIQNLSSFVQGITYVNAGEEAEEDG